MSLCSTELCSIRTCKPIFITQLLSVTIIKVVEAPGIYHWMKFDILKRKLTADSALWRGLRATIILWILQLKKKVGNQWCTVHNYSTISNNSSCINWNSILIEPSYFWWIMNKKSWQKESDYLVILVHIMPIFHLLKEPFTFL